MQERIGNITLDYEFYPGEDLYSDGEVEEEILEIVKKHTKEEFPQIIEEKGSWPILYHLSPLRENIVDWLPVEKDMKVLEDAARSQGRLQEKQEALPVLTFLRREAWSMPIEIRNMIM